MVIVLLLAVQQIAPTYLLVLTAYKNTSRFVQCFFYFINRIHIFHIVKYIFCLFVRREMAALTTAELIRFSRTTTISLYRVDPVLTYI